MADKGTKPKGGDDTKSPTATVTMDIKCPHCKKGIIVKHFRERVVAPVPGEYDEYNTVEKDPQKGLGLDGDASKTTSEKKRKIGGTGTSGGKEPHQAVV